MNVDNSHGLAPTARPGGPPGSRNELGTSTQSFDRAFSTTGYSSGGPKEASGSARRPLPDPISTQFHQARFAETATPLPTPANANAGQTANGAAADSSDPAVLFRQQFAGKASNRAAFHGFMKSVYGGSYDAGKAEQLRGNALRGDFGWLPKVKYANAGELGGANGAYDKKAGVIYLNEQLKGTELGAQTFVEEAGHHIDTLVNKSDTAGDEGELFRRTLAGENLSQVQVGEIRNQNDKGKITVDGRTIEVEFFIKKLKKKAKKAFKGIKKGIKSVGQGIGNVVKGAAETVKNVGKGVVDGALGVAKSLGSGALSFASNLLQGQFGGAFSALSNGLQGAGQAFLQGADRIFLQAPQMLFNSAWQGARQIVNGVQSIVPGGGFLSPFTDRVFNIGNALVNTGFGFARNALLDPAQRALNLVGGLSQAVSQLLRLEPVESAKLVLGSMLQAGLGMLARANPVLLAGLQTGSQAPPPEQSADPKS